MCLEAQRKLGGCSLVGKGWRVQDGLVISREKREWRARCLRSSCRGISMTKRYLAVDGDRVGGAQNTQGPKHQKNHEWKEKKREDEDGDLAVK